MREVLVGSGWDATGVPLPTGAPVPVPPAVAAADGTVVTAFMTHLGELVVDEWCDPLLAEVAQVAFDTRTATAAQAQADARLVACYLWGAGELARRSAGTEREKREWGARGMLAELAAALHLPETTLARRLARLTRLAALPRLLAAHERGAVSAWHVDVVLDVFRGVDDRGVLERADEFLAVRAERMTAPQLRATARGWRARNVPRTDEQRRLNLEARRVDISPADDDMCWLTALVPAPQALAIDARLDAIAAAVEGTDERSREEIRADALVDLLLVPGGMPFPTGACSADADAPIDAEPYDPDGAMVESTDERSVAAARAAAAAPADHRSGDAFGSANQVPGEPVDDDEPIDRAIPVDAGTCGLPAWLAGVRADVVLTVPVLSLLDRSDEPAELEGFGPIDIETARMLAANAPSFLRVLTHPETGAVLSVGRDRYRLPEDLRRAVQLRDVTCRFPGCRRPARRCDVDHVTAWADGGATAACNLECLCEKHHRLKHAMGWTPTLEPDGAVRWRSPLGLTYWTAPGDAWPPRPAPPPRPPADAVAVGVDGGRPDDPPF
ncbi:MAG: hypothetical protein BGO37_03270 [Cellulomonas sp. 73-92]|uniref:HNH endonuclease signature motif containing protein n=1 Tax=Cellulomonas sp. 73-92 TaxID=1895740 RepID=UPI00092C6758|nr:HNH endonuclease signature motif containing protein [Cellulomonas sp. 73-92]OJV80395.1 MAG: hypothetical protein BGO37_03270 [Cellulomonas sp. 73-92]